MFCITISSHESDADWISHQSGSWFLLDSSIFYYCVFLPASSALTRSASTLNYAAVFLVKKVMVLLFICYCFIIFHVLILCVCRCIILCFTFWILFHLIVNIDIDTRENDNHSISYLCSISPVPEIPRRRISRISHVYAPLRKQVAFPEPTDVIYSWVYSFSSWMRVYDGSTSAPLYMLKQLINPFSSAIISASRLQKSITSEHS